METVTTSEDQTQALAAKLGAKLKPGDVVLLFGELGAGKTSFVKGLAKGLGVPEDCYVQSPTFALINEYPGRVPLYHVDLYRLEPEETYDLGLEELADKGVVAIEWPEKLPFSLGRREIKVYLEVLAPEKRKIKIEVSHDL